MNKNGDVYEHGNLTVVPIKDQDTIAFSYLRLKNEKLRDGAQSILDLLFYEGAPELSRFMQIYLREGVITFGCYRRLYTDETQLVGLGKLEPPVSMGNGYLKAEMSLVFFKEFMRREITVPIAHMLCEWIFDRTPLDVIFGCTPVQNKAMISFSRHAGFTLSFLPDYTTWKGEISDVLVSSMSEKRWKQLNVFPD